MAATVMMMFLLLTPPVTSFRILIAPFFHGFNSRLLNMQKMADMLAEDGHHVDVIMSNRVKDHIITKHANVLSFNVPDVMKDVTDLPALKMSFEGLAYLQFFHDLTEIQVGFCESLFADQTFIKTLQETKYDLIIGDFMSLCSGLITSHLNTTTIFYQNYGFFAESTTFYPMFPSFTCLAAGTFCESDDLTFAQRTMNTIFLALNNYYIIGSVYQLQNDIAKKTGLELNIPLNKVPEDKIMLVNVDYVLDTPRPTMPHVIPISGLYHKKPSPLRPQFQKIVEQSGQHGVILMSFGTLMPKFDPEKAERFANVFGSLKQQVIWRYIGENPKGLKNNTHLTEWFPQNDLLANPATKLFITHCGVSSTFESAYNGVPVIAMPLFADQTTNAAKLIDRVKMGVRVNYFSFSEEELKKAIDEVLSNPAYQVNAKQASLTMSDQVVSPVQQLRHLVNFTIKTEGAKHLFHPYAVRMHWFTYFSVDVISFISFIFVLVIVIVFCLLRAVWRCCCKSILNQSNKYKVE